MNKINYQKELEKTLSMIEKNNPEQPPRLLLHSCCAPCSSYVLEYLAQYFEITVLYYNPNIFPKEEYTYRIEEQNRLITAMNQSGNGYPIFLIATDYEPEAFYEIAKGLEQEPEGGERCFKCYELRLREAARYAKEGAFDYFTTTLSISPLKNAAKLNEIGRIVANEFDLNYLYSDFKKKNGYQRSVELSAIYHLYRQDYCGCVYSKMERDNFVTVQP